MTDDGGQGGPAADGGPAGSSKLDKAWAVLGLLTALALAAISLDLLRPARAPEVTGDDDANHE